MARAHTGSKLLAAALSAALGLSWAGRAQPAAAPTDPDARLSPECRVPASLLHRLAPLPAVRRALRERQPLKVLALGSVGEAAGGSYAERLQGGLERLLGTAVEVEQRSLPGEITADAVEHITRLAAEDTPGLVVWQVGADDALAKSDLGDFAGALDTVLAWFAEHDIDVVLVEPPYGAASAGDEHQAGLIAAIQAGARARGVPLVLRFEALQFLGRQPRGARTPLSAFGLQSLGARCIAEHVSQTVALSLQLVK